MILAVFQMMISLLISMMFLVSTASRQSHKGLVNKTMEQEKLMIVGKGDHLITGGGAARSVAHITMEVMG